MIRIKTERDIEILKEGGRRHAFILDELKKKIFPGATNFELNEFAEHLIKEGGDRASFLDYTPQGAKRPYPSSLIVSINEEIVHGISNEELKTFKEGDIVSIDLGLTHKNLITDAAITVPVGKVSKENMRLIEATKEALLSGIKEARYGNTTGNIGYAIESVAKKRGFSIALGLSGHGVGYEVHEDPYVPNSGNPGHGEKLIPGMVIAIEPMFVVGSGKIILSKDGYTIKTSDGKNSAHFEHTVLITEKEAIILTNN